VQVTDIFFTHLHYDHCLDYIRLLMTRWDQGAGNIPELNVYGPAHTAKMTDSIINDVFGPDLEARTELPMSQAVFVARGGTLPRAKPNPVVRELNNNDTVDVPGFRVKVHSVIHAQPILECFGYRLEAEGASFAYSGDAGPCKAMEDLARNADVMVHMCHFISGTALNAEFEKRNGGHLEIARLAQAAGVRNLVASHITEQMDVPGVRERLIREMSEIFKGNLFFGEDLMEIPVGAPGPRKLD
jgi:ribonuclease Z